MSPVLAVAILVGGAVGLWLTTTLNWLTPRGAVAAGLVAGLVVVGLGPTGLGLLGFFFVSSSFMTRILRGRVRRALEPGSDRDASGRRAGQVFANGGVAGLAALAGWLGWLPNAGVFVAGALAAATADTWASEIGEASGRSTRLITTWKRVEPGTNGGVSWVGSFGALLGSAGLGLIAALLARDLGLWLPVAAAGVGGMLADSLVGATLEDRLSWVTNDGVNWIATLTGALVAGVAVG